VRPLPELGARRSHLTSDREIGLVRSALVAFPALLLLLTVAAPSAWADVDETSDEPAAHEPAPAAHEPAPAAHEPDPAAHEPAPAAHEPAPAPREAPSVVEPAEVEWEWYGWQNALFDGLATALYLTSFAKDLPGGLRFLAASTGAIAYGMGGAPHEGKGSFLKLILSTSLRTSAMLTAVVWGAERGRGRDEFIIYLPMLAVSAIDIALLARHARPVMREPMGAVPFLVPIETHGVAVGLSGAF